MMKFVILVFILSIGKLTFALGDTSFSILDKPKYSSNFKHFDFVNPVAPKTGTVKFGVTGTFNSLNPFILKGISAVGINAIYDSLMFNSEEEIGVQYPLLADGIWIKPEQGKLIYHINSKAKFSDGSKITAEDVVFTFNSLKTQGHPSYRTNFASIKSIIANSDEIVEFNLKNVKNKNLILTIGSTPILSKNYREFTKTSLNFPLGNGAYKIESLEQGKSITFVRDKNYWGANLPVNVGRYNFDRMVYTYYKDESVMIEAFKAGEFDFRSENIAKNWKKAYNNSKKIASGEILREEIPHSIPTGMQAFVFNLRREKFQDRRVRQALSLAFDFEWQNKNLFHGSYKRNSSFFQNTQFASSGVASDYERRILKNEYYFSEFKNPMSDGSGYSRQNLIKARDLLFETGYRVKNRKLVDKNDKAFVVEFLIINKSFERVVLNFAKNLAILGIDAKIKMVDFATYKKKIDNFEFDIITNVFSHDNIPGQELFQYWHSSMANVNGGDNVSGMKNSAVDDIIVKALSTENKEEFKYLLRSLDRVLLWEYIVIPQWHLGKFRVLYNKKLERPKNLPKYSLSLDSWWVNY